MLLLFGTRAAVFEQRYIVAAAPRPHDGMLNTDIRPGSSHDATLDIELTQDRVEARIVEPVVEFLRHDEVACLVALQLRENFGSCGADDAVGARKLEMPINRYLGLLEVVVDEHHGNALLAGKPAHFLVVLDERLDTDRRRQFWLRYEEVLQHVHDQQRRAVHRMLLCVMCPRTLPLQADPTPRSEERRVGQEDST